MSAVSQLWQTPVRQDHRTGTSHASANSRMLWNAGPHRTLRPVRAKDTSGPVPTVPAGACGGLSGAAATPGVLAGPAPNVSLWIRLAATPQVARLAVRSVMKAGGPHR